MSVTTQDVIDFLIGAGSAYGDYSQSEDIIEMTQEQGTGLLNMAEGYGQTGSEMAEFKPFTVTSGTGATTTTDATGGVTIGLSPEEKALQDSLMSGAGGLFNRAMTDPNIAQQELYKQLRAVQRPEEERDRLALEERMLSQGRLGLSSDAYGGATPELLAQAQAKEDAMLKANLAARSQSISELGTFGELGTQMLTGAYTPSSEAIGLLGAGTNVAQLADLGRREGAQQYINMLQKGFDPYIKTSGEVLDKEVAADNARWQTWKDLLGL